MDNNTAALILDKMGNPTRLGIVRLLVRAGDDGMTVGAIQKSLGIPASTLTHHLNHLKQAGLVSQERNRASLVCRMEYERLNDVIAFLTEECCMDVAGSDRPHQAA